MSFRLFRSAVALVTFPVLSRALSTSAPPTLPPLESNVRRLFLVRHGEVIPPGGIHGKHYGDMDVPLSPLGEAEATAAAGWLKPYPLHSVFSSPLSRAVFGAEEIRKGRTNLAMPENVPLALPGFKEMARGAWRGMGPEDIGLEIHDRFNKGDESVTPEGGESVRDVKERVLEAQDAVLSVVPLGSASCVVSHLWVTRSMISDALGIEVGDLHTLAISTASISCIDYDEDGKGTVVMQSYKPEVGLELSTDKGN